MPDYRRWRVPGGSYFFTVNLLNRRQRLLVDCIDALRDAFRKVRGDHPFHIDAIVILPEHLHASGRSRSMMQSSRRDGG